MVSKEVADEFATWALASSFVLCVGIAAWQFISHGRIVSNADKIDVAVQAIHNIEKRLEPAAPVDVLEEVRQARDEFRSSRFTHADGVRMTERIDRIVEQNELKESSE